MSSRLQNKVLEANIKMNKESQDHISNCVEIFHTFIYQTIQKDLDKHADNGYTSASFEIWKNPKFAQCMNVSDNIVNEFVKSNPTIDSIKLSIPKSVFSEIIVFDWSKSK